jgi:hypothetical protein
MPHMILPLLLVGGWATLITCISHFKHNRESDSFTNLSKNELID